MPRVKIDMPLSYGFHWKRQVEITDLNYGNHLGNDRLLTLAHEARVQFLHSMGFTEIDIGGASLIMADAEIQFLAEGHYKDALEFYVHASNYSRVGFELFYYVYNRTKSTPTAFIKTGMVCFDYKERKVVPLPEVFISKVESLSVEPIK